MMNKPLAALLSLLVALTAALPLFSQDMPTSRAQMERLIGEEHSIPDAGSYSLGVEEAVELALENNLTLVGEAADLRIKKRTRDTAWNVLIPTATASTTLSRFNDPSIISGYDGELRAGISFQLRLNPQLWFGFRQTSIDYELGLIDMEQARKDIRTNVQKQFYTLLTL
jgi:outer membrane protein TolC